MIFKNKDVREALNQICHALGRKPGSEMGQWNLGFQQGLFRVEVLTPVGKIYPLGEIWRSPKDFVLSANFALLVLNVYTDGTTAQQIEEYKNESSRN